MNHNLISNKSVEALHILVGRTVHVIWTPRLDAAGAHLAAPKLSMMLEKDLYVNFSCTWSETQQFLNDSWLIDAAGSSEPIGMKQNSAGVLIDPCEISMYNAQPIERIAIYEYRDESDGLEEESVHYDRAIHFQTKNGRAFCISCMLNGPGIATDLHFSEDPAVIQEMIDESTLRLTIE